MNAHKIIAAEEIAALTAVTAGELLAQGASKGFPAPRRIVAVLAFYGVLGWVASLGTQAARVASAVGALVTLLMFLGPAGFALEGLISKLSGFAQTPAGAQPAPPGGPAATGGTGSSSGRGGVLGGILGVAGSFLPAGSEQAGAAAASVAGGLLGRFFGGGPAAPSPGPPGSAITGSLRVRGLQPGQVKT